jgi:hypothetical protein
MCHLKSLNIHTLSLGRTSPENKGLILFKDGWGAVKEDLVYSRVYYKKNREILRKDASHILQKPLKYFPLSLLKIIGLIFYRFAA